MRQTTIFEKLGASVINVLVVFVILTPFYFLFNLEIFQIKIILILLFFIYNVISLTFNKRRDLGMLIVGSYWREKYNLGNQIIYSILYTLSFATLLFWVYFPFDLFLVNMLLIQLPTILLTGTTFHGLLSGRMETVKR